MEEVKVKEKPKIYINPPPRDFHCEICGRKPDQLKAFPQHYKSSDIFAGHRVFNKDRTEVILFKTYRGSIQISASWECVECVNSCDINDVCDYFTTDYPEDDYPNVDSIAMNTYLDELKKAIKESKENYIKFPGAKGEEKQYLFSVLYWKKYFKL